MSENIVTVEKLSKRYLVGHQARPHGGRRVALRDVIAREARDFARKTADAFRGRQIVQGDTVEDFWALKDVNFEVKKGDVVGIIGRNGAGKSTLLKILSRITEPTEGRITIRGRVGSLLEVGTGFHSELTGRENIFLNGAILGMKSREVRSRFDEIVAFAEVERFLDTPVKHYSTGMFVRLAFAVAAHLEPEILILDEVLSVGDAEFQKKCLRKMDDVSHRDGRTVLFVTHNMETLLQVCNRAILLQSGTIGIDADTKVAVSAYLGGDTLSSRFIDLLRVARSGDFPGKVRISQAAPAGGKTSWSFSFGEKVGLEISIDSEMPLSDIELTLALFSTRGFEVASWTSKCEEVILDLSAGRNVFRTAFRNVLLLPGQYFINAGLRSKRVFGFEDLVVNAITFEVLPSEQSARINAHTFHGAIVPSVELSKIE